MATGPETRLIAHMRKDGAAVYGERLVIIKYHGSQFGEAGVSDLLCCLDGRFIAVEVKAPESYGMSVERAIEKGPSVKQRAFLNRVSIAGGGFAVVASREGFLETLAAIDATNREGCYHCQDRGGWDMGCHIHPPLGPVSL